MNLANKLTLSRVVVIPVFMVFLLPESFRIPSQFNSVCRILALLIFIGASITDYYDGVLARRHNWISNFGQLFDPLADKLIVMTAYVGMVELKIFPSWMVILILCREFLITGLRTLAVSRGKILSADRWGKNKTISQMTTIITALVYLSARDILTASGHWEPYIVKKWGLEWWLKYSLKFMMLFCVVLTVVSGYLYMRKNWNLVKDDLNQ
ncbi:CDP-diacylglycerol--glycerol-3-phosphate 3-phosphatidyltransferase [Candidatus Sumerlaeota bacterium]|nr:CDP-diacylglycerol--glycerol-3-phosphate 3-phosphatidyltransferase [Candidatus Sumerlaeota bacterium]